MTRPPDGAPRGVCAHVCSQHPPKSASPVRPSRPTWPAVGEEVLYFPSELDRGYRATVASEPRALGSGWVVRLYPIEPAYQKKHHPGTTRNSVPAASLHSIRPLPDQPLHLDQGGPT